MGKKSRIRRRASSNNVKDTWQNTAKEQPYLMPGTSTYEERQEDLQLHDPFRPDDDFHQKLEKENAGHSVELAEKGNKAHEHQGGKHNYQQYIRKEAKFAGVKSAAEDAARRTETVLDDRSVQRMSPDGLENLEYNNGVSEDDYLPKALQKYL